MKKTITRTSLATLLLVVCLTFSSYAQTYHHLYLCGDVTATLHPEEPVTPLVSGDKVHWFLDGNPVAGNPRVYNGSATSIDLVIPISLGVGLHRYTSVIETAASCMGPASDEFEVFKLPTKTLALTATNSTYCAESSNSQTPVVDGSVITATTSHPAGAPALPAGIEYAYEWSVTKDGAPFTPLSDIGATTGAGNTTVNNFEMTVKDKGTYVFSATVKYVRTAANTGAFISADSDGCEVSQTATQQVIVTPKPTKPTITITP